MMMSPDTNRSSGDHIIIDFTPLSLGEWRDFFTRGVRPALTQSYDYARAVSAISSLRPKWGVIREKKTGNPCGMVQIFEASAVLSTLQTVIIDRGPVWFTPTPPLEWHLDFWATINRLYPRRLGRVRRFIPECLAGVITPDAMINMGFTVRPRLKPYQTIFVDLTQSSDQRRAALRKSWRQIRDRAEQRDDLTVHHNQSILDAAAVLHQSRYDARRRGYPAPPQRLTNAIIQYASQGDGLDVFTVTDRAGVLLASALVIRHGSAATWQVGVVSDAGRDRGANHILLWSMIETLSLCGVKSLDLGGVNNDNASGIYLFKSGIGGDHVTLCGAYG